jgi:hypothetical protein
MTPNLGAGGNAAIESAAALANSLAKLQGANPSLSEIRQTMQEFQANRCDRVNSICDSANKLTRLEALATLPDTLMALHVIPALGDFLADVTCDGMVGATRLDALPVPPRSLEATMPWNPESGIGKHEKKWVRSLYALPLLGVLYACHRTMGASLAQTFGHLATAKATGMINLDDGNAIPLLTKYSGVKSFDDFVSIFVAVFTPSIGGLDPESRSQMIAFLGDLVPFQAIWMVEGIRRGNFMTAAHLL